MFLHIWGSAGCNLFLTPCTHSYGRAENNAYFCQMEVAERFSHDPGKIQDHQNCCIPTDLPPPLPNTLLQKIPSLALISADSVNNYSIRSWGLAYIQALCLPAHSICSPSACSVISSLSLHAPWTWSLLCLMTVINSIECLCCINAWSPLQSQLVWQAQMPRLSRWSWGPPACTLPSLQLCRGPTLWIPLEDAMCQAPLWNSGFLFTFLCPELSVCFLCFNFWYLCRVVAIFFCVQY